MDPTFILVIVLAVIALWFASALIMLYIMARDSWVSADNVVAAAVFGPGSFFLILWFKAHEVYVRVARRIRRMIAEWRS